MKLNRIITMCAVAATLATGTTTLLAQDNNGGPGRYRGNWNPAQMQQRILDRYQEALGFTNTTEWDAVKPLVQKVMEARRNLMAGMARGMFGPHFRGNRDNRPNDHPQRRFSRMFQPSPEAEALQKAIDNNASNDTIKDLLAKYQAAQKAKRDQLATAQSNLRAVLSVKQEAQATLMGLLN